MEQIVDPVSRGGISGSSSSHSPAGVDERADEPGEGVFRTFPKLKKRANQFFEPSTMKSSSSPRAGGWR